jgi:3-hydroxyisobutyrate dehydrogenase-like beta-hydroxyacid dehydrogenase
MTSIGVLHPGEMGAGIGMVLVRNGHEVLWASEGRSPATAARADAAGLRDVGDLANVLDRAAVVLSICPPHAARDVAAATYGYTGVFVDANAISPDHAADVARVVAEGGGSFVDGSLIGAPPPHERTRLYLSGPDAAAVEALFGNVDVDVRVLRGRPYAASALKMSFAAWTKGTSALVLAVRALARALEVEEDLVAEWSDHLPELLRRSEVAARQAAGRGWRWEGEMREIAATFAGAGLPAGFHDAAAEIYGRVPRVLPGGPDQNDQNETSRTGERPPEPIGAVLSAVLAELLGG